MEDLLYCLKISIIIFFIAFIFGLLVGFITQGSNYKEVFLWGTRMVQFASAFGLGIAALGFVKHDHMRPLNYQKQWEDYFKKLNFVTVILFIAIYIAVFSYSLEAVIKTY